MACDAAIEAELQALTAAVAPPTTPLPPPRVTRRHGNEPHFDIRPVLHHLTGADLTQIDGLARTGGVATKTASRYLEDLSILKLANRHKHSAADNAPDLWEASDWLRQYWPLMATKSETEKYPPTT